jgi:iron-sulfur cluster assembly protein
MQILTITEAAASRLRDMIAAQSPSPAAVLVSITTKGCSGMSYDLQFIDRMENAPKYADLVSEHGITVVVDPKASLYLVGSTMDYQIGALKSGFEFINPNETARCGCGESFSVAKPSIEA